MSAVARSLSPYALKAGSRVRLAELIASNSVSLDFTAFDSALYDDYLIDLSRLYAAVNGGQLSIRYSTDGGATYISAASSYSWTLSGAVQGSAMSTGSISDTAIRLTSSGTSNGLGTTANKAATSLVLLSQPGAGNGALMSSSVAYARTLDAALATLAFGGCLISSAAAVNGLRLFMDNGNIAGGIARIYGIRKS